MPNKQIQSLTVEGVTYDIVDNTSGYITGITSSDVTGALGFTPYNATNPNGYTTNTGTITGVKTTAGTHTVIDISSGAVNFNIPTKTSHLTNDSGFITGYTETDPIFIASAAHGITSTDITNWNNKSDFSGSYDDLINKPTIPTIPTNVSAFTNDAGYLTSYTETDPTVPAWAKASTKPSYNFSEINSKPTTVSGYGITDVYTMTEVDNKVSAVLRYKGVKSTVANLPTTDNVVGDVWHVTATSGEYAWDGTEWQELGTAISIPAATGLSTTDISIADHSSTTIYGVGASTTSVTGVSGSTSVYGVKSGTNSTTTASKASGANGTAPTLGTPISVPNVTNAGTASTWSFSDITIPIRADADTTVPTAASSATTVPIKNANATTIPTAASSATSCDDITNWDAGSGTLTFTMDSTDTKKLVISHVHTAPSLSYTARSITGVSGSTSIYGVQSTTTSVTGVSGSTTVRGVKTGTSSTTTASKASGANGTAPTLGTAISIPNVTDVGSASTWSFTDVTVPIRADNATTVPTAAANATTVPIKNANTTTVITDGTHNITDSGHTHTI